MRFLLSLLGALLLSSTAAASSGVPCERYGINAGAPVWQGQTILDASLAQKLAATGARSVRIDFLLDDQPSWNPIALGRYDAIVDAALAAGLEPLGLVNYGAVPGGQAQWNDDPDGDGMNGYVDEFASTTQVLLPRYAGKIRRWEIWNEPNCWNNPSYASDPKNAGCTYLLPRVYAKLLAETFVRNEALLAKDAGLVTGGLFAHDIGGSWSPASDYMTEVYAQGVWDWLQANKGRRYAWDHFGYHLYVDQDVVTDGKKLLDYLDELRALASKNSDSSPFLITEVGWNTDSVSETVQAQNLTTAFAKLEARSDVGRVYWFSYQDFPGGSWGLLRQDGTSKPALGALQTAAAGCTVATGGSGGTAGSASGGAAGAASGGAAGDGAAAGSGAAGSGGSSGTGSGAAPAAGAASGATSGGATSTGGAKPQRSEQDSGCGCRAATGGAGVPALFALFAGLALVRRRKTLP